MFCTNCGNKIEEGQRFCTECGNPAKGTEKSFNTEIKQSAKKVKKPWTAGRIIKFILVTIFVLGLLSIKVIFSAIGLVDQEAVSSNEQGLTALNSGDYESATQHMENAADSAVTSATKMTTLTNLGYIYSSDGKTSQALSSFKEALGYATPDSFDYYLINGEIALLENNPQKALQNYNKAYDTRSNDFQINNALNLFYLDLEETHPTLADPEKALDYALTAYRVSLTETKGTAAENLAIAYFVNEDYNTAITYFKQTNQEQSFIKLWLGMSYYALEDYDTAKPYLQKAYDAGLNEAKLFLDTY